MGMFDSFILKHSIKCPGCDGRIGPEFQTKELESDMSTYFQGEPAVSYLYRAETDDEYKAKIKRFRIENPEWFDEHRGGELKDRYKLFEMFGSLVKTDDIRDVVPDGVWTTYDYCKGCEKMVYVDMVVYRGIFLGIKGVHDSFLTKLKLRFKKLPHPVKPETKKSKSSIRLET